MGETFSLSHASCLYAQLPKESRVYRRQSENDGWNDTEHLLVNIEYYLQLLLWRDSKDAKHKRNVPKPHKSPREQMEIRKKLDMSSKEEIDKILGGE